MKSIQSKDLDLNKKKVLIRLDLNVPIIGTKIIDTNRIDKIIPTLNFLIKSNAKIIILSHIGRPKGNIINEFFVRCFFCFKHFNLFSDFNGSYAYL